MTHRGFPHSDIPGSKLVCSSPRLFAAYCVLHRLLAPRHSPYALSSLTIGMELRFPDARRRPRIPVPLPTLTCNTAVFLWIGKTTVCRIFSCQRPWRAFRLADPEPSSAPGDCRPIWLGGKTMVENTGLEPVTSWLQTRRSPS